MLRQLADYLFVEKNKKNILPRQGLPIRKG
jgi:hypothetical protein